MLKKILICFSFFFAFSISCSEKKVELTKNECDQIKDIVTDCLQLHRGAFNYIKNCGDLSLEKIEKINNCKEILYYIENK